VPCGGDCSREPRFILILVVKVLLLW
jgi:hypothetical protein